MARRTFSLAFSGLALPLVMMSAACGQPRADAGSRLSHEAGRYTQGSDPSWYADIDPEAVVAGLRAREGEGPEVGMVDNDKGGTRLRRYWTPLNETPVRARLQSWVDHIDATLRATPWGAKHMAQVPKPNVILREDAYENAMVPGGFVRFPVEVNVPARVPTDREPGQFDHVQWQPWGYTTGSKSDLAWRGIVIDGSPALLQRTLAREASATARFGGTCKPVSDGRRGLTLEGAGCPDNLHASSYLTGVTLNALVVHTKLVESFDEELTVAVLAHELGHYYRAHATPTNDLGWFGKGRQRSLGSSDVNTGYLYFEDDFDVRHAPRPIQDEKLLRDGIEHATRMLGGPYPKSESGAIDAAILRVFGRPLEEGVFSAGSDSLARVPRPAGVEEVSIALYLSAKCTRHFPNEPACAALFSAGSEDGSDTAAKAIEHSRAIETVLGLFPLSETPEVFDAKTLSASVLSFDFYGFDGSSFPFLVRRYEEHVKSARDMGAFAKPVQASFLLQLADRAAKQDRARGEDLTKWASDSKLAWYTTEQEADDFAVEVLSLIGVHPSNGPRVPLVYERLRRNGNVTEKTWCDAEYENSFRSPSGVPRRPGYWDSSDWYDIHHSNCYRVFSMVRESRLHKSAGRTDPQFPFAPVDWSALQRDLAKMLAKSPVESAEPTESIEPIETGR